MEIYHNKFHNTHIYLKFQDEEISRLNKSEFDELIRIHGKPLQVMISSEAKELIEKLEESGFILKRRCFEMEVGKDELNTSLQKPTFKLKKASKGSVEFTECVEVMYDHYKKTHETVSPMTATMSEFQSILPEKAVFLSSAEKITAAAFVEDNEIAYICVRNESILDDFCNALLCYMFEKYTDIVFEADDTDSVATYLRDLFVAIPETSFNTYIKH